MTSSCSYQKLKSVDIESCDPNESPEYGIYPTKPIAAAAVVGNRKSNRRGGCLKTCLCVTLFVIGLLLTVALIAGACAYRWMAGHVREWTVTEPHHLPVVDVPDDELNVFKDQAILFFDLIQAGQAPGNLVVSSTNLNGLAASSDFLRGNAYAVMESNEVTVSVSLPMDFLPGGKNRYLVGEETLTWDPDYGLLHVSMVGTDDNNFEKTFYDFEFTLTPMDDESGRWDLRLVNGVFFDQRIPQEYIEKQENILKDLYECDAHDDDCKQARKILEGLNGISLEEGQVVLHGRQVDDGHRMLLETVGELASSYKPGWKGQLVRRLLAV